MYLLDPTEGLSRDELLQHIWDVQLTPPLRAKVLGIAQTRGCTWQDIFRELFQQYDKEMDDPVKCEAWMRMHEEMERQRAMPLGQDPLLREDGHAL